MMFTSGAYFELCEAFLWLTKKVYYMAPSCAFQTLPQNLSLKKFLIFFPKKIKNKKKIVIFSEKKAFLIFRETELLKNLL